MTDQQLINLTDYAAAAPDHMDATTYGYYAGGADDEITLQSNRDAYQNLKLAPHTLVDVSQRTAQTSLFGHTAGAPLVIAPMAMMRLVHTEGEKAVARAASRANLPMTVSTMASTTVEDVSDAATAPLWFQLYVYRDRNITEDLITRVESAGYTALVLTVDAAVAGNRERDTRNAFSLPEGIRLENLRQYALDNIDKTADESAVAAYATRQFDPSLTWNDLDWLASLTDLPILVKGILRPDDAKRALDHGAAGVIVSNHGGRQLDTTPPSIHALPAIADEVGFEGLVLVDGGIRRGTDILKAIALGANAVMVGRPLLWGLAVNGEQGAAHVLEILEVRHRYGPGRLPNHQRHHPRPHL